MGMGGEDDDDELSLFVEDRLKDKDLSVWQMQATAQAPGW